MLGTDIRGTRTFQAMEPVWGQYGSGIAVMLGLPWLTHRTQAFVKDFCGGACRHCKDRYGGLCRFGMFGPMAAFEQ